MITGSKELIAVTHPGTMEEATNAIERIKDAINTETNEQVKSVMTVAVNVLEKG